MVIDRSMLDIPKPITVNEYSVTKKFQFFFVADEAFALKPFILQPFPRNNDLNVDELIFN